MKQKEFMCLIWGGEQKTPQTKTKNQNQTKTTKQPDTWVGQQKAESKHGGKHINNHSRIKKYQEIPGYMNKFNSTQ